MNTLLSKQEKIASEWARRAAALADRKPDLFKQLVGDGKPFNGLPSGDNITPYALDEQLRQYHAARTDLYTPTARKGFAEKEKDMSVYRRTRRPVREYLSADPASADDALRGLQRNDSTLIPHEGTYRPMTRLEAMRGKLDPQAIAENAMTPLPTAPDKYMYRGLNNASKIYNETQRAVQSKPNWWSGIPDVARDYTLFDRKSGTRYGGKSGVNPDGIVAQMSNATESKFPSFNQEGIAIHNPDKWNYTSHIYDADPKLIANAAKTNNLSVDELGKVVGDTSKRNYDGTTFMKNPYYEVVSDGIDNPQNVKLFKNVQGQPGAMTGNRVTHFTQNAFAEDTTRHLDNYFGDKSVNIKSPMGPQQPTPSNIFDAPVQSKTLYLRGPSRNYTPAPTPGVKDFANLAVTNPASVVKQYAPAIGKYAPVVGAFAKNVAQAGTAGLAEGLLTSGLNQVSGVNPDDNGSNGYWSGVGHRVGSMVNGATAGGVVGGATTAGVGAPLGALGGAAAAGVKNIYDAGKEGVGMVGDLYNLHKSNQAVANNPLMNKTPTIKPPVSNTPTIKPPVSNTPTIKPVQPAGGSITTPTPTIKQAFEYGFEKRAAEWYAFLS